jgi:hypothetical protein
MGGCASLQVGISGNQVAAEHPPARGNFLPAAAVSKVHAELLRRPPWEQVLIGLQHRSPGKRRDHRERGGWGGLDFSCTAFIFVGTEIYGGKSTALKGWEVRSEILGLPGNRPSFVRTKLGLCAALGETYAA